MKAQLKNHNGTPTVFIDDRPAFFGCHLVGYMYPDRPKEHQFIARRYGQAGIHIYSVDNLTHEWVGPGPGREGQFDFAAVGPRLQSYIEVDPEAAFLMRVGLDTRWPPSNWFNEAYPDEVEVLSDGTRWGNSFASAHWLAHAQGALRALIEHLQTLGLYDRVLGFQIGAGSSGEWIKDVGSMTLATGDYSPAMRRHFQGWLRARYGSDLALQAAWNDPAATLATAAVPSADEQLRTTTGHSFRDPRRERKVIDYYACYAELCADNLIALARTVRAATGGEKLVGGFFGYVLELAWNMGFFATPSTIAESEVSTLQRSGHLGLGRLLAAPEIDFLVSPHSYGFRGLGGDGLPMQPAEALRRHGKIYFMEEDALMHNNFDPGGRNQALAHHIAVYQRNFAQCLTHAHGVTWYETAELHEHDSLVDERARWLGRFQRLGEWALGLDRTPASEVGVFLDLESFYYESGQNNLDLPLIWRQRLVGLNRFGAPHDIYLLDDLLDGGLPDYKLYVFLNPFHLNDRRRAKLKQVLRRDGRVALWLFAPGLLNDDDAQPAGEPPPYRERLHDLTGLRFGQGDSPWGPLMHVTNFRHPITRGLPQDWFWGSTNPIGPLFHLEDPEATTLGQVAYSLGRCKPGFGVRTFNAEDPAAAWSSVFLSAPDLPAPVLRGIARWAGVHLYNEDGDVLYATRDLLSTHSVAGGPRRFALPRRVEVVYDLFREREVARDTDCFDVVLEPASTDLWYTGPWKGVEGVLHHQGSKDTRDTQGLVS